jgi:replicative DNA helicase
VFKDIENSIKCGMGLKTGLKEIDDTIGGFQNGELVIIAARPSMGKSSFAINIVRENGIKRKIPLLIFSLEMSKSLTTGRILFGEADCSYDEAQRGILRDMAKVSIAAGPISEAPIYVDDTAGASISQIVIRSEQYAKLYGIRLIIIDHLGLIGGNKNIKRHEELSEITKSLHNLARRLNLPVIALSQLSRNVEYRNPPRPMLSDLRESGSIEEDSDKVLMLYRDDYYNKDSEKAGICEVIVAKNRNGRTGYKEVAFDKRAMQFKEIVNITNNDWQNNF